MNSAVYFQGDSRTNRERMLAGEPYIADDPESGAIHERSLELSASYASSYLTDRRAAEKLLPELLGEVGSNVVIRPPIYVDYGKHIFIGDNTFINFNLTALDVGEIRIGKHCQIGPNVQLLTPTHPVEPIPRRDCIEGCKPITLGDNVWLGGGVIVCPGVTIGENSVIGAGAVVVRDIPANSVAVGNPARVVRTLDPEANPFAS